MATWALLAKDNDIFSLEPDELGCTDLAKHEIRVVDDEPFKEQFHGIPPSMVDEVQTQIAMDKALKQYTAFTVGSLGFFECEWMPFGLCNVPTTFQRLMQNDLGELNLTYCLIYLDNMIVFLKIEEEHIQCLHIVYECFQEHNLKLKSTKCEFFKNKINYLAHHVSQGVRPSKENLKVVVEFAPLQTYTEVQGFLGLVGH